MLMVELDLDGRGSDILAGSGLGGVEGAGAGRRCGMEVMKKLGWIDINYLNILSVIAYQ